MLIVTLMVFSPQAIWIFMRKKLLPEKFCLW